MKRMTKILALLLAFTVFMTNSSFVDAASVGSNMTKILKYYKNKNYTKAKKYCKKIPKTITEPCVKKMSSKMKKAYLKVVKKYVAKSGDPLGVGYLWDYYLTDINNDKKADLLINYGTCEADVQLYIYQYKKGKAVKVASTSSGHTSFHAYPNHKGIIAHNCHMGGEFISVLTLKNGKIKVTNYGDRYLETGYYLNLRATLKSHTKYDKNYKRYYTYGDLK